MLWCDRQTAQATLAVDGTIQRRWGNPLEALDWMAGSMADAKDGPPARWVGYLSYDAGRWFENLPAKSIDDLELPLFVFTYHVSPPRAMANPDASSPPSPQPARSNFTRLAYIAAVARAIEYIRAGDVFQVNLSHRFSAILESPRLVYDRLRALSPAAHGAFLDYGDFALLSNSPELFLRVTPQRRVITRPIKGTRPRSPGMEALLRDSPKDQAELNMIVDLERNDLGRVCEFGSVKVTQARVIEAHPTIYHGVATIEGVLREEARFSDLLAAMFPSGSVTGAPKIRAMQIIDEIEGLCRGPYCGAIGYLASDGSMEFNVAIRTMIAKAGWIHIPVGGGVVADSDPQQEYEETLVKAQAMFAAVGISAETIE